MKIIFGGHNFVLHHGGVAFWPSENLLLVSDLHLEKGSHFAGKGRFLPPYDTAETLKRLWALIEEIKPARLAFLGDCFHDEKGYGRLGVEEKELFSKFLGFQPIWIKGNHDGCFAPQGFEAADEIRLQGMVLRHQAQEGEECEISGHYHPKVELTAGKTYLSRRCFIADDRRLILPSFGAYTGGLSVHDPAISALFTPEKTCVYALGSDRVHAFPFGKTPKRRNVSSA